MRLHLTSLLAAALLALPLSAANADSLQQKGEEAERLANEAIGDLMRALDLLITTVPRYAAPEVLPNGDIIIRRLDPKEDTDEPVETSADSVET